MVDRLFAEARLAALYDALCAGRPDFAFYLPLVMGARRVLDVGCGTGELLRTARQAGHRGELCGLDPAAAMLEHARVREDVDWVLGDVGAIEGDVQFDLVVMTGHAFQVLITDAEVSALLRTVRSVVAPDGTFVFETRNPLVREWERWTPDHPIVVADQDGKPVRVVRRVERADGEHVSFTMTFTNDAWERAETSRSTLRFLTRDALSRHLTSAGWRIEAQYGDWTRQPLSDLSPEIITVARGA
jgi:ubiquinone/menaquinone biosynthesis C-methylase UbiE